MAFFTVKDFCLFVNIRTGTFIIALICAVVEFISLIINFAAIWNIPRSDNLSFVLFLRFALFMFMLFTILKLALCACLYVGLLERRPDHLEMWYRGYAICAVSHLMLTVSKAIYVIRKGYKQDDLFWIILIGELIVIFITFYFILVVRSYHHQMCRQPNFYQDFSYQHTKRSSKIYSEKPKAAKGEIVIFAAPIQEKQYGLPPYAQDEGMVYVTPQSSDMNLPVMPSVYLDNDRRPSTDGKRRLSSVSKPPQNLLGFDNHVDLI